MSTSRAWSAAATATPPPTVLSAGAPLPWPGDLVRVRHEHGLSLLILPSRLRLSCRREAHGGWRLTRSLARIDGSATIRVERRADESGVTAALLEALIAHAGEQVAEAIAAAGVATARWRSQRAHRVATDLAVDLTGDALADAAYGAAFAVDAVIAHAAARGIRLPRATNLPWLDEARDDLRRGIDRDAALRRAVRLVPRSALRSG